MRCGTVLNRMLSNHRSPTGEMFGATVAENALIEASLSATTHVTWDFISSDLSASQSETIRTSELQADLSNLGRAFPGRVRLIDAGRYQALSSTEERILVTSVPTFPTLANFRRQNGLERIPICCLVHSLNATNYYTLYSSIVFGAMPHDRIVASSSSARYALEKTFAQIADDLCKRFGVNKNAVRLPEIVTVPFGVSIPDRDAVSSERARRQLGIPPDAFVMLYLGRISAGYKADMDILLRALLSLSKEHDRVHLIIAGQVEDPAHVGRIRMRATSLGLANKLTLIENFPEFAKSVIVESSNVVVMPSDSIQETFGLAILEGMAHAKPIIASSWSGYRDLVIHNETGFLIGTRVSRERLATSSSVWPMTDVRKVARYLAEGTILDEQELVACLRFLCNDPSTATEMGERGRKRADENFAWTHVVSRFMNLWGEQIAEGATMSEASVLGAVDYEVVFRHYADEPIDGNCEIAAYYPTREAALHRHAPASASALFEFIRGYRSSFTINDLVEAGKSLNDILRLLKHGACTLKH